MSGTRLLAIGLIALVAVVTALVALRDGSEVTAQPPDVFDRLDDIQDDLTRVRSDVEGVRSEVALARGELVAIRGDIAVLSDRLGRLTRALRPSTANPAAYTQAFVEEAIARYERDGLDATVAHYNTPASVNGQWYVVIIDESRTILAVATRPATVGQPDSDVFGPDGYPVGAVVDALATRDGAWVDYLFANPENGATELKHAWVVRHDGLIFLSGWYEPGPSPVADPAAYTRGVVARALQLYRALGRERTLAHYNTGGSIDGQWYLFVTQPDLRMLAHAQNPALVGQISAGSAPDGYPVRRAIVGLATEAGAWIDYSYPNPESGETESKHTWAVSHDGLIFASGWYEPGPSPTREPGAFTRAFVARAVQLYNAIGRDETLAYYNSPDSAVSDWYMFIHQTDGTRLAHAYGGEGWLGTNIGDLGIDVTGYAYGEEMLAIEQSGWVSYVFVNPADEHRYQRKHSWIVTHDGLQFGSGWYDRNYDLRAEDPAAYTKAYVQNAIDYYETNGREATIARYQSSDSIDGEWYLFMIGEDGIRLVHPTVPDLVGQQIGDGGGVDVNGFDYGAAFLAVTDREWISYVFLNAASGQNEQKHTWMVRHDGILFGSGWYER